MFRNAIRAGACVLFVACLVNAQQVSPAKGENEVVPSMVSFNGVLTDINASTDPLRQSVVYCCAMAR
jgi:hypothetical protein